MHTIWIALRKVSVDNDTVWKWEDGSPFVYENWQLFQPNECCGEDITCARMNWLLLTGAWFDTSCLEKNGVVCKYDPAERIVPTSTLPPSRSSPTGSALDALAGFQPIWLGLKHLKGGWVWTDDSPLDYVNWHSSQPDRCCGTDVSCVTTNWIFENGKWFDSSCQALSGIVCKYNPQTRQVQPSSDTSDYGTIVDKKSNTKCDNAFIPWRGNCYYSSPTKVTYQRAFILCAAMNANLYTSHSAEEDAFVSRLAEYKSIWLGLNKIRNDWVWSDLSKLDYQNWQRFQPDNCCGKHVLCAELRWIHNKPKWMDTCCMKNYGVVCKYNATTGRINAVRAPAIINQLSGILTADQSLSTTTSTTATLTTTSAPSNSFQPIRSQQTDFVFATPPSFSEFTIPHLTQQLNYIQQNIPKSFYKNEYNQANNYYPEADTKLSQNKATEHKKLAANQATKSQGYYTTNDQFSTHSPTPLCRCPKNWVLFNDYCYQVYKSSSGPLTTIVAAAKCRRMGAELASACSDSEFALFENMAKPFEMHDPLFGLMVDKLFGGCTMSSTDRKTVCCHINWLYGTPKFGEGKWNTCPAYSPDSFNERSQCALTKYASVYGCKLPCQP
uniref:C-type lectin domain-containing protein n=1 Tax=Syphacia muris TaxID=451379 RepID=A0A0N5AKJ1_9BILA